MRSISRLLVVTALTLPASVGAQTTGGTISGVVLNDAGVPLAGADVLFLPDTKRAKTDSLGRFAGAGLDGGFYHVRVRRLGYTSVEITTDLTKNGHVDLKFELHARPAILDSMIVTADGRCPEQGFRGFVCRRGHAKAVFLTDDDLLDKGAVELGDVFRDVDGFRIEMTPTPFGMKPRPLATRAARCLNALVNGRPLAVTNQLPRYANELVAVEIYALPTQVPEEYQRFVWMRSARQTVTSVGRDSPNARCSLVVYWTAYN
jgi:hypothetical protein